VPAATKVRENPASYDDHYSQARLFWKSMSVVEQEHIVLAYTFELAKCYEQAIKERQLLALANIDADLCTKVAQGLGLPAPEPAVELPEPAASPALSQVGESWPSDGRMIGIVADPAGDLNSVDEVRRAVLTAGMVPLVIGPHGGDLGEGLVAQRTFGTARSVEFDAVLVAGAAPPAPDAVVARDVKAGRTASAVTDPRVLLLLEECFRHSKALGAWGDGQTVLEESGCTGVGVVLGDDASGVLAEIQELLGLHRVWQRFGATV
jgi:catalase